MGKTQALIKETFDDYFDRLKEMADLVQNLKRASNEVHDRTAKSQIERIIEQLECEIKIYAEELKTGGKELMRVA